MIRSFKDRATEQISRGVCPKGFPAELFKIARRKLAMIDAAVELSDLLAPPGNRLHLLKKDRKGQHAIRINDQYRVCFEWRKGDALDVEITDYH